MLCAVATKNLTHQCFFVLCVIFRFSQAVDDPFRKLQRSHVGAKSLGDSVRDGEDVVPSSVRTSHNAFDDESVEAVRIMRRAFRLLRMEYDAAAADGIQVLRYELGQAYIPHHDHSTIDTGLGHNWDPRNGGTNRFATVFLYLNDVEEGTYVRVWVLAAHRLTPVSSGHGNSRHFIFFSSMPCMHVVVVLRGFCLYPRRTDSVSTCLARNFERHFLASPRGA